jgi:hypothetical protein
MEKIEPQLTYNLPEYNYSSDSNENRLKFELYFLLHEFNFD